jgi:hypothetical protein
MGRMPFSAILLSISSLPSVKNRVSAARRLIVYRNAAASADLADNLAQVASAQIKKASISTAASRRCATRSSAGANAALASTA